MLHAMDMHSCLGTSGVVLLGSAPLSRRFARRNQASCVASELTGDARLEFLRNSGPAPEMLEH